MDVLDLLDSAQDRSVELVALVEPADHHAPTPRQEWTVSMLLERMLASARMYTALAQGEPVPANADPDDLPRPHGPVESPGVYAEACGECHGAFFNEPMTGQMLNRHGDAMPRTSGVMSRVVDVTIDSWDLARALDVPAEIDLRQAELALDFGRAQLAVATPIHADTIAGDPTAGLWATEPLDQLLILSGRNPNWTADD